MQTPVGMGGSDGVEETSDSLNIVVLAGVLVLVRMSVGFTVVSVRKSPVKERRNVNHDTLTNTSTPATSKNTAVRTITTGD